ncbi:hypothetical protein BC351_31760 [Paenibacillus ferrarius]|uniref:Uncharacterized protein n=1 Tax=Paenibacillus ferrarius TaxID=1469647 RepID=A0A1V4HFS4_9BACL|nr:hypothetical protein BC351_31760 [Paenibacillus ferrarius]
MECIQYGKRMFLYRRNISTNAAKFVCPSLASECTGYLLLYLVHPLISFNQIVIKGNVRIAHEAQHFVLFVF